MYIQIHQIYYGARALHVIFYGVFYAGNEISDACDRNLYRLQSFNSVHIVSTYGMHENNAGTYTKGSYFLYILLYFFMSLHLKK